MDLQLQAEILLEGLNEIKLKNNDILNRAFHIWKLYAEIQSKENVFSW